MEIEYAKKEKIAVGDLQIGECFSDIVKEAILIKTDDTNNNGYLKCVSLYNGAIYNYNPDYFVTPVRAKVVVEE